MTSLTDGTRTALRSAAFLLVVVLAFGAAFGLGRAVGPIDAEPVRHDQEAPRSPGESPAPPHDDSQQEGDDEH